MTGSYAAYPEIPVCFPFVGFHRNQPVLALFMPTGHRNDMDDLTHPCHHLEESAHVLEYPHASLMRPSLQVIVNGLTQCTSLS